MLFDIITAIFVDIDDFCQSVEKALERSAIASGERKRRRPSGLCTSEIIAILVGFHRVGFRCFKHYYGWLTENAKSFFPGLVSYNRFIELMPRALVPMCMYLTRKCKGQVTGISFIDSTKIEVCHKKRIKRNKVFDGVAATGKSSMGWFHGFKLHIVVNDKGELLGFTVTPGNVDDRKPVEKITQGIVGKLFGDKGYISQKIFSDLFKRGLTFITNIRSNMKERILNLEDKLLLRKRSLIETINDQLKNVSQLEHTRHRSVTGFMLNLMAALISYALQPKKPSLNFCTHGQQTGNETPQWCMPLTQIA